jgi:hypothetical protein
LFHQAVKTRSSGFVYSSTPVFLKIVLIAMSGHFFRLTLLYGIDGLFNPDAVNLQSGKPSGRRGRCPRRPRPDNKRNPCADPSFNRQKKQIGIGEIDISRVPVAGLPSRSEHVD